MPGFLLKQTGSVYGSGSLGIAGDGMAIAERILAVAPANLLAMWPLTEPSGTTVYCANNAAFTVAGGHTGVTLGQPGVNGYICPLYDGINDTTNIYTAAFAAAFSGVAGTIQIYANYIGVWADALGRIPISLSVNANNFIYMLKTTTGGLLFLYSAGGTQEIVTGVPFSDWNLLTLTWDKAAGASGEVKAYQNNAQVGVTQTTLGVWSGVPAATTTRVGGYNGVPNNPWSGLLQFATVFNKALSLAEIQYIYGGGPN